jgi:hypothetical protein
VFVRLVCLIVVVLVVVVFCFLFFGVGVIVFWCWGATWFGAIRAPVGACFGQNRVAVYGIFGCDNLLTRYLWVVG